MTMSTGHTRTPTARAPGTTSTPARTGEAPSPTGRTAGSAARPRTTRRPAPTPAAPQRTGITRRGAGPRRTTRGPAPTRAPPREATSTGTGGPRLWCGATTGPARRAPAAAPAAPRPSGPRAGAAPSWREATTTCMSARTATSIAEPTPVAGTGTRAASGAEEPRASIRPPPRASTVMPSSGPPAPAGQASPRPGEAVAEAGGRRGRARAAAACVGRRWGDGEAVGRCRT